MSNSMPLAFNPREESAEVLEEMLVGRREILNELESDLLAQAVSATRQHWLIRGPRGIGKTHLIAVLYHRILKKPELSYFFLPVWLGEAEAYNAYSAGMLLYAVANRLAEELDRHDHEAASALRMAIEDIGYGGDDPALFNSLCQLLKKVAQEHGKILVVLMENLDVWLQNVSGQRGEREAGRLRALLSDDKEFLFISTTPTRYLPKLSRPSSPLYGHLRERKLHPMSEEELRELFGRLARLTGRKLEIDTDPGSYEARLRWRVLVHLAGGNPRAAVMAFSVISDGAGVQAMVGELNRLLDAQTAYYETRLGRLAPRERAIVAALALSPTTLTISEIARESRLPERSLSTQIKRLLDEGHISHAGDQRGKGSVFEVTDGLFRTWHHYRYGRRKLEPLVRFLALWHTESELESALSASPTELVKLSSSFERDLFEATEAQIKWALDYARSPQGAAEREQLWQECGREIAEPYSYSVLRGQGKVPETVFTARDEASEEGNWGANLSASELLARLGKNPDPQLEQRVANAIVNLGVTLGQAGKAEEEIATYRDLIAHFGENTSPELQEQVARAMQNLGITLGQAGKAKEEIATYRELITRFGESTRPELQEQVARATVNLGVTLGKAGKAEEAIATYRDLITHFGESPHPVLQEGVARAMLNLGVALGQAGKREEEIATYRELITLFGGSNQPELQEQVATGIASLGIALGQVGKPEEEIATYRHLITRFGENNQREMQERVVRAMVILGLLLGQASNAEEAITTFRDLVTRFGETTRPELQEQVARGTVYLGIALARAGKAEEAITTFRDLITHFGETTRPELQEQVARAMLNLGITLGQAGRAEEEVVAYRDSITHFGESPRPEIQEQVAKAMLNLGITLGQAGKIEEEIGTYSDLIARFGESTRPGLQDEAAKAMLSLGFTLFQAGKPEEALSTYRDLIARFGENDTPSIRETVAAGLLFEGVHLSASKQAAEALEVATRAADVINSISPRLGSWLVVPIQILLSNSLHSLGRKSESRLALKTAASRLASMPSVTLSQVEALLKTVLCRLPLPEVRQLLGELSQQADPEVKDMARLHGFVLEVLEAQEAPTGRTKLNLSTRKRRALARVPPELRAVVAEKADIVRKERRKG